MRMLHILFHFKSIFDSFRVKISAINFYCEFENVNIDTVHSIYIFIIYMVLQV